MQPNPPHVVCQGNQLSIVADNSTLGSILAAVQSCTGLQMDLPGGDAGERSYVHLGPGPTPKILDAFLGSTGLDYVLERSSAGPDKVLKVVLVARSKDDAGAAASERATGAELSPTRRAWMAGRAAAQRNGDPSDANPTEGEPQTPGFQSQSEAGPTKANGATGRVGAAAAILPPQQEVGPATEAAKELSSPEKNPAAGAQDANAAPATPAPAVTKDDAPAKELENKITSMQQLFEQRKKMTAAPADPPK